jgi:hypothetical protein
METGKNKKWLAGRIRSRNLSSQCAHAWISASAKQKITKRTHLSLEAKPAGQQLTTIPSQIRSKTNPFCTFKLRPSNLFQPLRWGIQRWRNPKLPTANGTPTFSRLCVWRGPRVDLRQKPIKNPQRWITNHHRPNHAPSNQIKVTNLISRSLT